MQTLQQYKAEQMQNEQFREEYENERRRLKEEWRESVAQAYDCRTDNHDLMPERFLQPATA